MKDLCYIILVHKNPAQVRRLVERLKSQRSCFYVHVDKNVDIVPFQRELANEKQVFFIAAREAGTWGDIGIVKGTLNALTQIVSDGRNGYCVLLSGQDYPLKPNSEIEAFLAGANGESFADVWKLPATHWYFGGMDRVNYYKFNISGVGRNYVVVPPVFSTDFRKALRTNMKAVLLLLRKGVFPFQILRKRKFPLALAPYGGSQWWAISTGTAETMLAFLRTHTRYLAYHKHTLLADEIFFQTLIVYFACQKKKMVSPSLTYVRWESEDAAHPVTFSTKHLQELKEVAAANPHKLFARKFDPVNDVLASIDKF